MEIIEIEGFPLNGYLLSHCLPPFIYIHPSVVGPPERVSGAHATDRLLGVFYSSGLELKEKIDDHRRWNFERKSKDFIQATLFGSLGGEDLYCSSSSLLSS